MILQKTIDNYHSLQQLLLQQQQLQLMPLLANRQRQRDDVMVSRSKQTLVSSIDEALVLSARGQEPVVTHSPLRLSAVHV